MKVIDFTRTSNANGVVYGNIGFLNLNDLKQYDEIVAFEGHKHLFAGYKDIKKVKFIKNGAKSASKKKGVENG